MEDVVTDSQVVLQAEWLEHHPIPDWERQPQLLIGVSWRGWKCCHIWFHVGWKRGLHILVWRQVRRNATSWGHRRCGVTRDWGMGVVTGPGGPTALAVGVSTSREVGVLTIERLLLIILAHRHARWVLSLALLPWHPLAWVVGRGQRPGGICRILPLLWWELTIRPILLTPVT